MNTLLKALLVGFLMFVPRTEGQAPILIWTFNAKDDADPATGTASDTTGRTTSWLEGTNTVRTWADGFGSSDPEIADNSAMMFAPISTEPTAPNREDGLQINVGYPLLSALQEFCLDIKFASDSADRVRVQYATNGFEYPVWKDIGLIVADAPGWMNGVCVDFSGVQEAVSNYWFGVRFVTEWASPAGFQGPGGAPYAGGPIMFDMIYYSGTLIPEPHPLALLAIGLPAVLAAARCTRRK
jgi:hypothetical protein